MEYPPPLCFATQNIGEVTRSGGGVDFIKSYSATFLPFTEEIGMCLSTRNTSLKFISAP